MELLLLALMMMTSLQTANADFEHTCVTSDYYGSRSYNKNRRCSSYLTEFIMDMCGGMPYLGPDAYEMVLRRKKRSDGDIFLDNNEANSFLRIKRSGYSYSTNTGIVCECCINTCTIIEIDQYCEYKRRKRSTDVENDPETALEKVYERIETASPSSGSAIITPKDVKKIQMLESTKRQNIAEKWTEILLGGKRSETTTEIPLSTTTATPTSERSRIGLAQILVGSLNTLSRHT